MSREPPKRALVTGAGSGLGRAIALRLAHSGFEVIGTVRDPAKADALNRSASSGDGTEARLTYRPLLLEDASTIDALVDSFRSEGLDLLVQNAGSGIFGPMEEIPAEEAERQFRVNYLGPMRLLRSLLPTLRERRGQVILVGSMVARFPLPFQADYSASKAALGALSDALRMELRPYGVRVTCLEPGDFATEFTASRRIHARPESLYRSRLDRCLASIEKSERGGPSPEWVAQVVAALTRSKNPPARVAVGRWARTFYFLARFVPPRLLERFISLYNGG